MEHVIETTTEQIVPNCDFNSFTNEIKQIYNFYHKWANIFTKFFTLLRETID